MGGDDMYLGGEGDTAVGLVVVQDHHLAPLADGEQRLEVVHAVVRDLLTGCVNGCDRGRVSVCVCGGGGGGGCQRVRY